MASASTTRTLPLNFVGAAQSEWRISTPFNPTNTIAFVSFRPWYKMAVTVQNECTSASVDLKTGKLKYITFKLSSDKNEIEVEKKQGIDKGKSNEEVYEDFLAQIKASGEPRFALFKFDYNTEAGDSRSKVVFISWIEDSVKIKLKMVYSSAKGDLQSAIGQSSVEILCTESDEMKYETVLEKCRKF